ncbi:hypothetical protein BCR42DRAFT_360969 [Absidia repens]|uniref:DUF1688 domain-containing protein n=1 Tax=Absidia repens TaxID=90262 RepID=A0A1X2I0H8_9FUNG|nr:hypothetical protein BCR42DRAFT_360969 [Absidia repens]
MILYCDNENYLTSLQAVRERCFKVQQIANKNQLDYFDVDIKKMDDVVQFVVSLIKRDYNANPAQMPTHGQWRHFDVGGRPRVQNLINAWAALGQAPLEQTRRIIDLFIIACLLDVESVCHNKSWSYCEQATGRTFGGTEGIAVAVLDMFTAGVFSSDVTDPHRVDAEGLVSLSLDTFRAGFQLDHMNQLSGMEERLDLIQHLSVVLKSQSAYFGLGTVARPGNLIDYLLSHSSTIKTKKGPLIPLETIWPVALEMGEFWAAQDNKGGSHGLGDVWPCSVLDVHQSATVNSTDHFVPFHKLTQWLIYSLIEPLERLLGATIEGKDMLTPLPDYCHGGLLMDTGLISLKPAEYERGVDNYRKNALLPGQSKVEVAPLFEIGDPVVVEWRALTVAYLDLIADHVRESLRMSRQSISLSQLMEAGTWSAGRELAEISRPNTHQPPIIIKMARHVLC